MNAYQRYARAFTIFAQYDDLNGDVSAEHDEIWAGPDPASVTDEHRSELIDLGWLPDPDGTWHRWV